MKRLLALLPLLAFCLFCAPAAFADAPVSYLDAQGVPQSCDTYTTLTDETTAWTDGWYLAEGTVTIGEKITVTGDVHLILADGASVTTGSIEVADGNALTLYAQSAGSAQGSLSAVSNNYAAAIGGGSSADTKTSGSITINGGAVTAITTGSGAAISGSSVTIQGGTVTAQSNGSCDIYGTFSTGSNGSARIYADTISDTSAQSSWSCLWVQKDAATVYGSITLTDDMTLDRPLTVYANGQLTVDGTLTCQNGLVNNGTLTNNGTVLVAGGDLENQGMLAIAATGTLHINGTPDAPRTLTNNGTLTVNGSLELDDTTLQNENATLDGTGLCVLTDKSAINGGTVTLRVEYRIHLDGNGAPLTDTMLVTVEHKPAGLPTPTPQMVTVPDRTAREAVALMVGQSNNSAAEQLYTRWPATAATGFVDFLSSLGLDMTGRVANLSLATGMSGNLSPAEAVRVLTALQTFFDSGTADGEELKQAFLNARSNYLTFDWPMARKYGNWIDALHDIAIVYAPDPYYVAVFTDWGDPAKVDPQCKEYYRQISALLAALLES